MDVVGRHVDGLGIGDDRAQARVAVGVAAAVTCGDGQLLDDAREHLPALGVEGTLLVLDRVPLGMAGHASDSRKYAKNGTVKFNTKVCGSVGRWEEQKRSGETPQTYRPPDLQTYRLTDLPDPQPYSPTALPALLRSKQPRLRLPRPRIAVVAAEACRHAQSGLFEPPGHLRQRDRSKRQRKPPACHRARALLDEVLVKEREAAC